MHESEKRLYMYEKVAEHLASGVHVIDSRGRTIIYNRKMREIEGMEIEDVLDKNLLDVFQFHSEEESTLLQVLKTKEPALNVKQTYFNINGFEITTINDTFPVFHDDVLIGAIEIARDVTMLEKMMRDNLNKRTNSLYTFDSILGEDVRLLEAVETGKRATRISSPVLICGEAGTGKELFAHSIHNGSSRSDRPFIAQNCASLPEDMLESLLFGVNGTEAGMVDAENHQTLFQQAQGGTLLLDEINSLSPSLQQKLVNILQGGTELPFDVRLIATVNEDPIDAIAEGRLLKDLYYRLSIVSIFIPSLRDRKQDMNNLICFFINQFNHHFAMNIKGVTEEVATIFREYDWPGNVRELEHVIEGAFNLVGLEEWIDFNHLPIGFRQRLQHGTSSGEVQEETEFLYQTGSDIKPLEIFVEEAETYYIQKALKHHEYNITQTAKSLGMSRQNLQYRIRKYGIERGTGY
ncbi:sigma 54-interacting transcriptional regulator [Rossellomorea aquimaris]|uniref:sigma-54 interaction domain-containing protein n=1 Tax=Rossellomorea aquimaris TaxID=189382 RepID=UPI001CD767F8|nr:sigma 54-interacting transcriptional regulator [Rossellomorea aquimaris]MCA1057217.1 sigma 54-interacting transcriptional regulator [Rossellomorea aquimaris]